MSNEDKDLANRKEYKWRYHQMRVARSIKVGKRYKYEFLSRVIAGRKRGLPLTRSEVVIFHDGDSLNIQRDNLVIMSRSEFERMVKSQIKRRRAGVA